jgi:hypothetical protein
MILATVKQIGKKGYIIPKEKVRSVRTLEEKCSFDNLKAKYSEAQKLCGSRDMSLASLDTLAENDAIQDWLGDLGLSSTGILTSLKKTGASSFEWLNGIAADFLEWAPNEPKSGDCASLKGVGLTAVDCEMVSNFICETKPATTTTTE